MTTIGSGVAGSIAASNLASKNRAQDLQAAGADEAAAAKLLRRLADVQQHQVEDTEQSEMDARPEDRRQRRRRGQGEPDQPEDGDYVELSGPTERSSAPANPPPRPPAGPHPAANVTGSLLDVKA